MSDYAAQADARFDAARRRGEALTESQWDRWEAVNSVIEWPARAIAALGRAAGFTVIPLLDDPVAVMPVRPEFVAILGAYVAEERALMMRLEGPDRGGWLEAMWAIEMAEEGWEFNVYLGHDEITVMARNPLSM